VGQLLRYMGWIEQNLAEADTDVRGTIAAREISDDLKLACKKLRNVDLFEYELSVELTKIRLSNQ
jgi:RecB family endonuclease NucS